MPDVMFDDRAMAAAMDKLKVYTAYKAKQLQAPEGGPGHIEEDLATVEQWANDSADDGKAWGRARQLDADQKLEEAQYWRDQVRKGEEEAAKAAEERAKVDMPKLKADIKKQLSDHQEAIKQLAEADQPGFKAKLAKVKAENAEAQQFLDNGLEKAMDTVARKEAEQRARTAAISKKMDEQALAAKEWKQNYAGQPDKWPAGQRADVEAGLDRVAKWAELKQSELALFGARSQTAIEMLKQDQTWAAALKPKVSSQGTGLTAAKNGAKGGVQHSRETIQQVEGLHAVLEREANENMELYRKWTDRNNELAKQFMTSGNPKQREWAEAWLKTQHA